MYGSARGCSSWMQCQASAIVRRERRRRLLQGVAVVVVFVALGVVL